ncbi:hypothetical protein Tco_1134843 [Tanacetum coccineum]
MKEEGGSSDIRNDDKNSELENEACKHKTELGREEEWIEYEQPLYLVDVHNESVYESLIKKMSSCLFNFYFRIEKENPNNLKIPCMIGRKFIANVYIDLGLPMNVMSLVYYNAIRIQGYEHIGLNFVGVGMDMYVFIGNISYVMYFTISENVEANIDPSLSQSSRVILRDDDVRRGCQSPLDLEIGFYKDIDKLSCLHKRDIKRINLELPFKIGDGSTSKGVTKGK